MKVMTRPDQRARQRREGQGDRESVNLVYVALVFAACFSAL